MNETMQYLNTLPNFVHRKSKNDASIRLIERFMKQTQPILQIDITGKYKNRASGLGSWNRSIRRTGYCITVKYAKHNNREYIFLIKDPDGTATL